MDNENSHTIREKIVDEALVIFTLIFNDDIQIGLPLLSEAYKKILGPDALKRIIAKKARALYQDFIEDCIDTRQLIFFIDKLLDYPENKDLKKNRRVQTSQDNLKVLMPKLDAQEEEEDRIRRNNLSSQPPLPRNVGGAIVIAEPIPNPLEKLTWKQMLGGAMSFVGVIGLAVFATNVEAKEKEAKEKEAKEKDL